MKERICLCSICFIMLSIALLLPVAALAATTLRVEDLDISQVVQSLGGAQRDKSFDGHALQIGTQTYTHGFGTHAESIFQISLAGNASQFTSSVGVDAETGTNGTAEFIVITDNAIAWRSGVMRGGDAAKSLSLNLTGVQQMRLIVTTANDGNGYDHADWVEPIITVTGDPSAVKPAKDAPYILTPAAPATPRINGARVFGVRPGSPFLFAIPATGNRPMTYSAVGLPAGLTLNSSNGQITGKLNQAGTYNVTLTATNSLGQDSKALKIVCGDSIALTPPMGWNSWNIWGVDISQARMKQIADAFVSTGLINHGWTYVNMDDGWQARMETGIAGLARKAPGYGLLPNEKFTDMKSMCDYLHGLGLKVGLYSTPWKLSYGNYTGGSGNDAQGTIDTQKVVGAYTFETQDANEWAQWGIDYLKYDWSPIDIPNTERMSNALKVSGRDIFFSLSNGATFSLASQYGQLANCWRTTGDISASWFSIASIGFSQAQWQPYAAPGHWNDPDMLEIGHSTLSPDEQYTHMSLWCLLTAPLLLGYDVSQSDAFTLNILSNDEIIEVNQDPLGQQASRLVYGGDIEVWAKDMSDGSKAVGIFNRGYLNQSGTINWTDLGISGGWKVRDLWRQQDMGIYSSSISFNIPWHGCYMVRVFPTAQTTHRITASAGAGGTINPTGSLTVYHGTNQTFTITPNTGYKVVNVTVDGVNQGAISSYTFNNITSDHSISATFADATTCGITATAGIGGTITPSGEVRVLLGTNKTFTITPSTDYIIESVFVDGADMGPISSYTFVNATVDHTISATFASTLNKCEAEATANTLVGGCIRRADGTWWTGSGFVGNLGGSASCKLTFNGVSVPTSGNYTVKMRYMTWGTRQVHVSVNDVGDYTFNCPEASGSNINIIPMTLPLIAGSNSIVMWNPTGWAPDIDYISLPKSTYTINASAGAGGSITPKGSVVVVGGANRSFIVTPDAGYLIADVVVDGVSNPGAVAAGAHTFTGINSNHTITASFRAAAKPVGSNNRSVFNDSLLIGKTIKTWGKVKNVNGTTSFTIDDGYGTSVTVFINGVSLPAGLETGKFAVVTGLVNADHTLKAYTIEVH